MKTWAQRKYSLASQSLGLGSKSAERSQGSDVLLFEAQDEPVVTFNGCRTSSISIPRAACPRDGTTCASELRRRPKLWRKQDYAYHSENKQLEREAAMIHKSARLRSEHGIPRPHSSLAFMTRRKRGQHDVRKRRPRTSFGKVRRGSDGGAGAGDRSAIIPRPPVYTRRRRARSAYRGRKMLVHPSRFRIGPPSFQKHVTKTGLVAGLAGIQPVYPPPQPYYSHLAQNGGKGDGFEERAEDLRTASEIEAAGSIFEDQQSEGSGSLKLQVGLELGKSRNEAGGIVKNKHKRAASDADRRTIWRRAAEGFAEAVLTRSIVAVRSASRRARAELELDQASKEKGLGQRQRIFGAVASTTRGNRGHHSVCVNNLEFQDAQNRGDRQRDPGRDDSLSIGDTAGLCSDDAAEGVEGGGVAAFGSASLGAVSTTGSTPAPMLEEFTEDGDLVIPNSEHQHVFELEAWIKEEAEAEDRRQKVLAAHADSPEKVERLQKLYAVDRERALAQLSGALPSVIGELFDDMPVEN